MTKIIRKNKREFIIPGGQKFKGLKKFVIPADYGLAAFIMAAAILCKSNIKIKGIGQNKERLKVTILVLDEKLEGANYLYLEGVIGLVKAMMDKDVDRIRMCMKFLFKDFEADNETLTDPLKLVLCALKFRPITQANIEEVVDRYKKMVEDALMAA